MSLALATLIYEWRRYMAAMIALSFAGLLVLFFVGMFMGVGKAFTANIDRSPADVMVLGPKAEDLFNGGAGLPARIKPQVYMNPNVVAVADLMGGGGMFQNDPGPGLKKKRAFVQVFAVDVQPGSVTLPVDYPEDVRVALMEPYAVAVDRSALAGLGVKLGDKASLNGKTIKIGAVLTTYPNVAQSTVVMSRDSMRLLGMSPPADRTGPLMVKVRNPAEAEIVRDELNAGANGAYRAWTRQELAKANESSMLKEGFIAVILGASLVMGSLIGLVITWQTLRGAILANIKEFASLRALGVSMGSLRRLVVELSFWVGIAGLGVTFLLVSGVAALSGAAGLPMSFPLPIVILVSIFLMIIALLSGVLSMGILKKSQPADLLR
ncbi:MAG: transporter permease [Caulobacter sp.]|jgi:putative ABC transport system permease protein|nr:transporter permease [Caulobacter sp.]